MSEHGGAALPHVAPGVNVEAVEAGAQASDVAGHLDNHHHHYHHHHRRHHLDTPLHPREHDQAFNVVTAQYCHRRLDLNIDDTNKTSNLED